MPHVITDHVTTGHAITDDGVKLYYEEAGDGIPIVFVHEFAGDHRSYEPQMRYFSRRYRCVAYNARGYPPSDVPAEVAKYSQVRACDDIRAVAKPVLRHRILPSFAAEAKGITSVNIIEELLQKVTEPTEADYAKA